MMRILFDHQMFSIQRYGGVTKYFSELMKNLPSEYDFQLSVLFSDNQYLKENYKFFRKVFLPLPKGSFKGKRLIEKFIYDLNKDYSVRAIKSNNFEVFHPTFYDNYFLKSLKKPFVITVHDLMAFKFKDTYFKNDPYWPWMEKVIRSASRIIAISNYTKKDIIELFNIPPDKIDVIYHGYNKEPPKSTSNKFGKYILFVGRRSGYKNFILFINAISRVLARDKGLKLICVGDHFTKEEKYELNKLKILGQSIAISPDESSLHTLYSHARVFVYPSIYEGFGLPILEAFANDCPVALSNNSCFPEIAKEAGSYFDPFNEKSILMAVEQILSDNKYRESLIKAGRTRLLDFSWAKTASQTIDTYNKVLL